MLGFGVSKVAWGVRVTDMSENEKQGRNLDVDASVGPTARSFSG